LTRQFTTNQIYRSSSRLLEEQQPSEAKMNNLHNIQLWELMRSYQAERLKEAEMYRLARKLDKPKVNWWKNLLRRSAQTPAPAIKTNATPELG
jgi:hypothetical protein